MLAQSLEIARLLCLMLALQPASAQYNRATSIDNSNGKPTIWWSAGPNAPSTSIVVSSPLPTIYYNCYYAQSLCRNVDLTQAGRANPGVVDMELVYDTDKGRRKARRKNICPGTWKQKHTCPETDQPDVWVYDDTRDTGNDDDDSSKPKKISNKLQFGSGLVQKTKTGKTTQGINYLIADFSSTPGGPVTPSGLMYTCDEFPFASTLQGGTGFAGDSNAGLTYSATTYCAPQNSRCGQDKRWQDSWLAAHAPLASEFKALKSGSAKKKKWMRENEMQYPESDQNLQGKALKQLASHFSTLQGDLFLYKLMTVNKKEDERFVYLDMNSGNNHDPDTDDEDDEDGNTKRDLRAQSSPPANITSNQARDVGFDLTTGLGNSGLGFEASSGAKHGLQAASANSTFDISTTSKKTSGFTSITRLGSSTENQQAASGSANIAAVTARSLVSTTAGRSNAFNHSSARGSVAQNGQSSTALTGISDSVASNETPSPAGFLNSSDNSSFVGSSELHASSAVLINSTTAQGIGPMSAKASSLSDSFTTLNPWDSRPTITSILSPSLAMSSQAGSRNQNVVETSRASIFATSTFLSMNETAKVLTSSVSLLGGISIGTSRTPLSVATRPSNFTSPVLSNVYSSTETIAVASINTNASAVTSVNALETLNTTAVSNMVPTILQSSIRVSQSSNDTTAGIFNPRTSSGPGTSAIESELSTVTSSRPSTKSSTLDNTTSSNGPSSVLSALTTPSTLHSGPSTSTSAISTDHSNLSTIKVPHIWESEPPVVTCSPPCIIILPPFALTDSTTITPDPITTKDQTITFPPITTDKVSFSRVTINNPDDKITPIPMIDSPNPVTLPDAKPPATVIPKFTVRLPILPPVVLETPSLPSKPSSTPLPPLPPVNTEDGADGSGEDEEEEQNGEEKEEEDGDEDEEEECDVPGWDRSDFPMPVPDGEYSGAEPSASAAAISVAATTSAALSNTIPGSSVPISTSEQLATSSLPPSASPGTSEPPSSPSSSTSEPPLPPPSPTQEAPPPPPPPPPPPAHPPCKTWRDCDCDPDLTVSCSGPAGGETCHCG